MSDHNGYLDRSALGSVPLRRKSVHIEEWDGEILIRELSHAEKAQMSEFAMAAVDAGKQTIRDSGKLSRASFELIRMSWIGEDGTHVLTLADMPALIAESDSIINQIVREIRAFNGLDEDANNRAKKNLEAIQNGVSGIN